MTPGPIENVTSETATTLPKNFDTSVASIMPGPVGAAAAGGGAASGGGGGPVHRATTKVR